MLTYSIGTEYQSIFSTSIAIDLLLSNQSFNCIFIYPFSGEAVPLENLVPDESVPIKKDPSLQNQQQSMSKSAESK